MTMWFCYEFNNGNDCFWSARAKNKPNKTFAFVFRVPAVTFVPTLDLSKPIDETLSRFIYNEKRGLAPKPRKLSDAAVFAASSKAA
jgi:hypothetical protein